MGDYRILDTDYDNYTVIYNCTGGDLSEGSTNIHYMEYAWILTRTNDPPQEIIDKAY